FAWAEGRPAMDWSEIHSLSRIYPTRIELEGAEAQRAEAIAARLTEIEEQWNAGTFEGDEEDADAECDRLSEELEKLTHGYDPADVSRAGVIAFWDGDSVRFEKGVVRGKTERHLQSKRRRCTKASKLSNAWPRWIDNQGASV
ncbi:MAG: hypothetical protein AAGK23_06145, partial [Pseudomonadota bacterium]